MIPNGKMNATLLHLEGDGYRLYSLNGCSWRMANVRTAEGNIVSNSVETTCRIPHPQQKPSVGDLLILGQRNVEAKDEIALVRLMNALNASGIPAFRVQRVKDNSIGAPLPHYAAIGA